MILPVNSTEPKRPRYHRVLLEKSSGNIEVFLTWSAGDISDCARVTHIGLCSFTIVNHIPDRLARPYSASLPQSR